MLHKQIANLVNDSVKDALGKNAVLTKLNTTDLVSLGKAINDFDAYEGFYKALANRIVKTVFFVRSYKGRSRSVLRDEHQYGAYVQKVYYELPDAVNNPEYVGRNVEGNTFTQSSPYDVQATIKVSSLVFGGVGVWSQEFVRPISQIRSAFLNDAAMMNFIDGIYVEAQNKIELDKERLVADAVNTSMAVSLNAGIKRNLFKEYNDAHAGSKIDTVKAALESPEFLKFCSKEINKVIDNIGIMSTVYNKDKYATFTPKDKLVVEMLSEFASATDMYLQADTFHQELTKLPNYEKVPFWQGSGSSFSFDDCSKINVQNDVVNVEQGGIICFIRDEENVAANFGKMRSWELNNPRSNVMIHGENAELGFAVDTHANAVVFYLAPELA